MTKRNPTSTKRDPGRQHKHGAKKSTAQRGRPGGVGEFGLALRNLNTTKQLAAIERKRAKVAA